MARPKITLNHGAIDALLKSPAVQSELKRRTDRAAASAGQGYRSEVTVGRTRALAEVWPDTPDARRDNARNHTLMRARDQMR